MDSRDKQGRTPLHFACINSNRMVACLLLNHGADPHALDVEEKVNKMGTCKVGAISKAQKAQFSKHA